MSKRGMNCIRKKSRFNCQTVMRGTTSFQSAKQTINVLHSFPEGHVPNSNILSLQATAQERISVRPDDSVDGIRGGMKLIGSQRTFTTEDLTGDMLMIIMDIKMN